MNQPSLDGQSQRQDSLVKDTNVSGDLIFAPVQTEKYIETEIIQISVAKVTQQPLIKTSPYQGLKRFNLKDRERFFGRDKLIARLFEAVNRSNLSLVLGASGSGKSSVVRAGLIPELKKSLESSKFYDFIFTPNEDPFESLYRCLLSEEKDYRFRESEAKIALKAEADTLTKVISTLKKDEERWLIFVDQFEELFTSCHDLDKRNNFIEGLVQVAKSDPRSVKIVLAMRSDFLEQFSFYPNLGAIANQNNIHLVTDMDPDELRQAIEQPAARQGVVFEEGLVEQIIQEVEGQKGYLPLLQYTLDLLWQTECRSVAADGRLNIEDRTLNKTSYAALEGVRGALQKRVNEIYNNLNQDEKSETKQIFVKLVNIVETESGSKTVSRRANRSEFVGESVNNTVQTFIDENLLISSSENLSAEKLEVSDSESPKQSATVEIAHEILLSSWDKLKCWIEDEKEAIILKNWLADETRRWQKIHAEDESEAREELLKGSRLEQIVEFRKKDAFKNVGGLRAEENEFIDVSLEWRDRLLRQEKERRKRQLMATSITSVIFAGLAIFAGLQSKNANKQTEIAKKEAKRALVGELQAQAELTKNQGTSLFPRSILLALESMQRIPSAEAAEIIRFGLAFFAEPVADFSFEKPGTYKVKDGNYQATLSRNVDENGWGYQVLGYQQNWKLQISDLRNSKQIVELKSLSSFDRGDNLSPDGKYQVKLDGFGDNQAKVIEVKSKKTVAYLTHEGAITAVGFSENGEYIVTASGNVILEIPPHYSGDYKVRIWRIPPTTARLSQNDPENENPLLTTAISPDGKYVATVRYRERETVQVLDLASGKEIASFNHQYGVLEIAFSPDSRYLATGGMWGGNFSVWKIANKQKVAHFTSQGSSLGNLKVVFSPDGKYLATRNREFYEIWDIASGQKVNKFDTSRVITQIAFSPGGKYVTTVVKKAYEASYVPGTTIKVWNLKSGSEVLHLQHNDDVDSITFSPNEKYVAIAGYNNIARIWEVKSGLEIHRFSYEGTGGRNNNITFSLDEKHLATNINDIVQIWEVKSGTEVHRFNLQRDNTYVGAIAFSPDGKYIAIANNLFKGISNTLEDFNTLQVFDVKSRKQLTSLRHQGLINEVAFSPDGKYLSTKAYLSEESGLGASYMWLWQTKDLINRVCKRLTRNFSLQEWNQYFGNEESYRKTCPNLPIHPSLIKTGRKLAEEGNVKEAVAIFRRAIELEPKIDLDPETKTIDKDPKAVAENLAAAAKVKE